MLGADIHKQPLRNIAVHCSFTHNRFTEIIALNFTRNGGRGDFINAHALFDIADKLVIVADFKRRTVRRFIQLIFVLGDIRTVPLDELIMPLAPIVGITVTLICIFAALQLVVNGCKAYAQLRGYFALAYPCIVQGFQLQTHIPIYVLCSFVFHSV